MTDLPHVIRELIESVNFERKEGYLYLKNGLVLFLKGNFKAVKAGVLVTDIREDSIFEWRSIAGFKIMKETVPMEVKLEDAVVVEDDEEAEEDEEIDLAELGMAEAEAREGYDDR